MYKKFLGLLLGLLSSTYVVAGDYIIGASVGVASGGEDVTSLNDQLFEAGFTAAASTSGDIRTAFKIYGGYNFESNWGVNLAYVDLGEATVGFTGLDVPIDELLDGLGEIHPRSAQGVKLSATYLRELNKSMHIQVALGIFDWSTSYTIGGLTVDGDLVGREINQNGTSVSTGLGLVHRLTNNMSWHLDWDFYAIESEPVNVFLFGVSYKL